VTAARKAPTSPPPSAGVLAKYAQGYAREARVSEGRVRAWIAYMILAGVLERAAYGGAPRFSVKSGVALRRATLQSPVAYCVYRVRPTIRWADRRRSVSIGLPHDDSG
jgi:hypothetical protein